MGTCAFLYVSMRCSASWDTQYIWSEMDWNRDGDTSLFEFLEASDLGRRNAQRGHMVCREYYALKDASTLRLECPKP